MYLFLLYSLNILQLKQFYEYVLIYSSKDWKKIIIIIILLLLL